MEAFGFVFLLIFLTGVTTIIVWFLRDYKKSKAGKKRRRDKELGGAKP